MDEISLKALAKINLGLDVLGKREDGYHDVRMIMQTIHLYDRVEIKKTRSPHIHVETNLYYLPVNEDNLVYRAGFARSIRQARQMVNHGLINVDGKRVDIPSYPVKAGQVISLREGYRANEMFKQSFQELKTFDLPYIEKSFDNWSATLTRMPLREELPYKDEVNETLIVELYSK